MSKKTVQPGFEEFVSAMNGEAPHAILMRGLGIEPEDVMQDSKREVQQRILSVLDETGLDPGKKIILRDLLMARIESLIRPNGHPEGISMLDVKTLGLTDDASIKTWFRVNVGIDLDKDSDLQYAHRVFQEAIEFYDEDVVTDDSKIDYVNPELKRTRKPDGIYAIFKTAAGKGRKILISQACALLRIAAVINFIERDPLLKFIPKAEAALDDIMQAHIRRDSARNLTFQTGVHGDLPLPLARVERRTKTRKRIIAKLLHKPSNRAEEVLDHIGFRFTTRDAFDSMRLIYLLFFHPAHPVLPALNINVSRGKNALLSPQRVIEVLGNPEEARKLVDLLAVPTLNHAELTSDATGADDNEFSASAYKALHIVFELPLDTDTAFGKIHFPFEIQVVDLESMRVNLQRASHSDYIERQMAAVRRRITENNILTEYGARFEPSKQQKKKR